MADKTDKIAYIVPSEAAQNTISEILADEIAAGHIDVLMIDILQPEEEYRRLCTEGYSCIIARGGTYRSLAVCAEAVPVLEERIRTADILGMLAESDIADDEVVCVVLHQDAADGAENFSTISGGRVHVYRYRDIDHLKVLLAEMPETDVKVFTSGYAHSVSDRDDLDFIEFRNRPHTVRETVRTAKNFVGRMREGLIQVNTLNSIYNNIDEGIVIFDKSHSITEANDRSVAMLGIRRSDVIGAHVYDLVSEMPARRRDGTCSIDAPRTFTGKLGRQQISYTVYPFELYHGERRFMMIMQDVTRIQSLEQSIRVQLASKGLVAEHRFSDILTNEDSMKHVISKAQTIAGYEGSVLIYGESGTGKELFAQSIHNASLRRSGPFVAINCAALAESLLESELFGYAGGAFTGARKEGKAGLFELAHNGTIFLDEVNSTPPSLQSKILRVIESQQVMRVGSDHIIPLNVRVISASNGNLAEDIDAGKFRRDLYYRLNTFELAIPPMRERKEDILLLFRYYLKRFAAERESALAKAGIESDGNDTVLSPEFESELLIHSWMGNVREIRSVALRYNAFGGDNSQGDILRPVPYNSSTFTVNGQVSGTAAAGSVAAGSDPDGSSSGRQYTDIIGRTDTSAASNSASVIASSLLNDQMIPLSELSGTIENLVIQALEEKGLSRTDIAKALGISRQALYKKLNK